MSISFFLAKVLGLYFIVTGLSIIINKKSMKDLVRGYLQDKTLYHLTSLITLIIGILLVTTHNIWTSFWRGVISVISWIIFLKGVSRILVPQEKFIKWQEKWNFSESGYLIMGIITLVIGVYLAIIGFSF